MLRTDIGERESALQCTTDSTTCCRNNINGEIRAGEFHFPVSDDPVPPMGDATDGYYRNRDSQLIHLHRQPTGTITGQFRCNIPQASGPPADLYINIGEQKSYDHSYDIVLSQPTVDIIITIMPGGDNTAGDVYSLTCSIIMISAGLTGQPTVTWLDPLNNEIIPATSILTFNPLAASHAGTYRCRATLDSGMVTASCNITVQSECYYFDILIFLCLILTSTQIQPSLSV